MTTCKVHASGELDLYFYDELSRAERRAIEEHLSSCRDCRAAMDELRVIREALASRPDVSAPASGDWSAFMERLDGSLAHEHPRSFTVVPLKLAPRRSYVGYLAMAALLALVTMSVAVAFRSSRASVVPASTTAKVPSVAGKPPALLMDDGSAFRAMTEDHFERSKLVVLGLATKSAEELNASDWAYERELASGLLNDTRLYRLAAEDRGLDKLAGVMRDLELVLLQTSLTEEKDSSSIQQIQRLIRRRDLIEKMDVVTTTGL